MRTQQLDRRVLAASLLGALSTAGCQSSDFEPVEALAVAQTTLITKYVLADTKPNIMLLVDTSGSMNEPSCPGCSVTRWDEVKGAMSTFLSSRGTEARFGLTNFPADNVCAPAGQTQVRFDIPASLRHDDRAGFEAHAAAINDTLQNVLRPQGGTPTSESLKFVGSLSSLHDPSRRNYILLLTDGLPNCNPNNPINGIDNPEACQCTLESGCASPSVSRIGCLDADVSVIQLAALRDEGIQTVVFGLGGQLKGGTAEATLNAMAVAGGLPRQCTGSTPCARYYPVANQAELGQALGLFVDETGMGLCTVRLEPQELPSDPRFMLVKITDGDGTHRLENGRDYHLVTDRDPVLQITGEACDRLHAVDIDNPITLEVYTVQRI